METGLRKFKSKLPEPAKAALRATTRGYGRLTASLRTDPDFLIIGTKRGGTTSLWFALAEHPDVIPLFPRLQELKSPHYFDINYARGPNWYRSFFPTKRARARHEARTGRRVVAGEASPYYMFHPLAVKRIATDLPDVRLIVSLRDPVERLWSHYHERVAGGTEGLSIREALDAEESRTRGERERIIREAPNYYSFHHDYSTYLARGEYLKQLEPYLERFSPAQLLILRAEDFYADPAAELAKVSSHLGISDFADRLNRVRHYNKLPRSQMPADLRARLTEYYLPHVRQLQEALGRDFEWPNFQGLA